MTNGDVSIGIIKSLIKGSKIPEQKQALEDLLTFMTDASGAPLSSRYAVVITFVGTLIATNEKACNIFDRMVFDMQRKIDSQVGFVKAQTPKTVM